MIKFIILEDNLFLINKYKIIIDRVMMNYDIEYETEIYDKYKEHINNYLVNNTFIIYIMDYCKTKRTMEMIRYIRENQNNWQALIILLINNIEEQLKIQKERLFIMDYIDKNNYFEPILERDIEICLRNYEQRPNALKYYYKKTFYNIEYQRIIYIEKEKDNKRCIIKTEKKDYYIQGSLSKIEKLIDKRFIKCNRSYIINVEQMDYYDIKNNIISFKDGKKINSISRGKRKIIINYLRKIS